MCPSAVSLVVLSIYHQTSFFAIKSQVLFLFFRLIQEEIFQRFSQITFSFKKKFSAAENLKNPVVKLVFCPVVFHTCTLAFIPVRKQDRSLANLLHCLTDLHVIFPVKLRRSTDPGRIHNRMSHGPKFLFCPLKLSLIFRVAGNLSGNVDFHFQPLRICNHRGTKTRQLWENRFVKILKISGVFLNK